MADEAPTGFGEAIKFAYENRKNGLVSWPLKLIVYGETKKKHRMLDVVLSMLKELARSRNDVEVTKQLDLLMYAVAEHKTKTPGTLHEAAREVWARSYLMKSVSRLYDALAFQLVSNNNQYYSSLAKAVYTAVLDDQGNQQDADFDFVINCFKREYQS